MRIRGTRVVVEFDGRMKYVIDGDPERAHWLEKRRQQRLEDMGLIFVRVTWKELASPRQIVQRVRRALARAA